MENKTYWRLSFVFAAVYFFSLNGLGALPNMSVQFILKEKMKLTAAQLSYFQAVTLLAWVIKPFWGLISDALPLFGSRRKSYLILSSLLAAATWIVLAFTQDYTVGFVLALVTLGAMAYAVQDVVSDGLMIETGQPDNMTGKFQSFQWGATYTAMIITAIAGGFITQYARDGKISYQWIFGITALFPLITFFLVTFFIQEPPPGQTAHEGRRELKEVLRKKELWLLCLFLFFWNFSPSVGAPFFYYSVDTLKFTPSFLGILQAMLCAGALIGTVLFGKFAAKLPIRKLLVWAVFLGVFILLFHYVYFIPSLVARPEILRAIALVTRVPFGIIDAILMLIILTVAAKSAPQYAGGTIFALLMSFYNLGQLGSSAAGGILFSVIGLQPLIAVSALFSLVVLFFIPFLPIPEPLTPIEQKIRKLFGKNN